MCTAVPDETDQFSNLGHSYEDTVVPPSYDREGSVTHTCTICGESYTETLAPLPAPVQPVLPDAAFADGAAVPDATTTIADEETPLAGLVTLAELLEALRQYEGIEDMELPEDFQWIDHDYAQAIYWGLDEALVIDTEDEPLDPDEIVTVALLREVLENFVEYKGADLTVTVDGEDDMIVMDLGERLAVFYGELEAALAAKAT